MLTTILVLLVVYQLKHFFADYPLQTKFMLGKFKNEGWAVPLLAHVGVHGAFTLVIALVVNPSLWWLFLCDMVAHFVMDRLKAGEKYLGRFKALSGREFVNYLNKFSFSSGGVRLADEMIQKGEGEKVWWEYTKKFHQEDVDTCNKAFKSNTYFWWALGLDQMVHHLTHYFIIWMLVS